MPPRRASRPSIETTAKTNALSARQTQPRTGQPSSSSSWPRTRGTVKQRHGHAERAQAGQVEAATLLVGSLVGRGREALVAPKHRDPGDRVDRDAAHAS